MSVVSALDGAGAAVNYTGCTFDAALWPRGGTPPAPETALTVTLTNSGAGWDVSLPGGTTSLIAADFFTAKPSYAYRVNMTDTAGQQTTPFYGLINATTKRPA